MENDQNHISVEAATSKALPIYKMKSPAVTKSQSSTDKQKESEYISCHLCAIDVPRRFILEHYKSDKHKINNQIAAVAMERVQKSLRCNVVSDIERTESLYFCPQCVITLNPKDRQTHDKTVVHKKSVTIDKFLYDFYVLYANDDSNSDIEGECTETESEASNNIDNICLYENKSSNEINNKCLKENRLTISQIVEVTTTNDSGVQINTNDITPSNSSRSNEVNDSNVPEVEELQNTPIKSEVDKKSFVVDSHFCTYGPKIFCKLCKVYVPNNDKNIISHQSGFKHKDFLRKVNKNQ